MDGQTDVNTILFFLLEKKMTCEHSHSLLWEEKKTLVVTAHFFTSVLLLHVLCFTGLPKA